MPARARFADVVALALLALACTAARPLAQPAPPTGQIAPAQLKAGLDSITASDTLEKVATLASDKFEGRNSGYAGCWKAADWIAEQFKALALKPVGDEGTHFQQFTFKARGGGPPPNAAKEDKKKTRRQPEGALEKPHHAEPTTRNVVAVLEGSDPQLKEEVVILGAHYDHVGRDGQWNQGSRRGRPKGRDDIWNGADDNASGTAVVIEVAEAFAASGIRPRRSVMFLLFAAEEHGLFGSKHYCSQPLMPLEKTAAMINFDMVGYKKKRRIEIGGVQHAKDGVLEKAVENALKEVRSLRAGLRPWAAGAGSDHAPFLERAVPAIYFFNGIHKDYHTVDDELPVVSGKRMAEVAKVAFLVAVELADRAEKPVFVAAPAAAAGAGALGITVEGALSEDEARKLRLDRKQGGLKVGAVHPGTPAAEAGLEEDDVILAMDREPIRRGRETQSLQAALRKTKPGDAFALRVLRAGKRLTLRAKMPD